MADIPLCGIEAACEAYRRGDVGDGRWMPTAAEIRREAKRCVEWLRAEKLEIERLLTAKVVDHSDTVDREAMRRRFADLTATLRTAPPPRNERRTHANSIEPLDLRTPAERLEATAKSYRNDPTSLSASALKSLGLQRQDWSMAA